MSLSRTHQAAPQICTRLAHTGSNPTCGSSSSAAQGLIFVAAPHCPAAYATLLASSEIVWSYVWQLALLHQGSDRLSLCGAALILCSFALPVAADLVRAYARGNASKRWKAHSSDLHLDGLMRSHEEEPLITVTATPPMMSALKLDMSCRTG